MHQSLFEIPAPPHSGFGGGLRGLSPHINFILVLRYGGNSLEVTINYQWNYFYNFIKIFWHTHCRAGKNSRLPDIVRLHFENIRPISHYDETRWPNNTPVHLELSSSRYCQSMNYVWSTMCIEEPLQVICWTLKHQSVCFMAANSVV